MTVTVIAQSISVISQAGFKISKNIQYFNVFTINMVPNTMVRLLISVFDLPINCYRTFRVYTVHVNLLTQTLTHIKCALCKPLRSRPADHDMH